MIIEIPPRDAPGKSNTAYWENFLTDEEINAMLALPNWHFTEDAVIGVARESAVDKNVRSSQVAWLQYDNRSAVYWNAFTDIISRVNSQFFQFDLSGCYEAIQLGTYKAVEDDPGHYNWHVDADVGGNGIPRKLSMSFLLSDPDEFEGGELQVMTDNSNIITLEQKRGRAWFFPSWMLHRVTPVTRGIRRSAVLWVSGPAFR